MICLSLDGLQSRWLPALNLLDETNGEQTSLDIIVDSITKWNREGEEYYKATLLK